MSTNQSAAGRTGEFFRLLDAKDEAALLALWSDDPQGVDEINRGWMRGRPAMEAYLRDNLPHLTEIHSRIDDVAERAYGDIEVTTCMLHQSYVFDGTAIVIEAPTTVIWHREGVTWKVVLLHSIPLSPEA